MNILLRIIAVLALLGSLGYGSYAVGRYVLSEKLFGNSLAIQPSSGIIPERTPLNQESSDRISSNRPSINRASSSRASSSRPSSGNGSSIEVEVLPANQSDAGPEVSSIKDLQTSSAPRRTSTPSTQKLVNANTLAQRRSRLRLRDTSNSTIFGERGVRGDGEDSRTSRRSRRLRDEEERPRRRRRRRRSRRSETTTVVADSSSTRSSSTRSSRSDSGSGSSSSSSSSRRRSSDDGGSSRRSSSGSSDGPARSQSSGDSSTEPF